MQFIDIVALFFWIWIGYFFRNFLYQKKTKFLEQKLQKADETLQNILSWAEKKYQDAISRWEKDIQSKMRFLDTQEQKLNKIEQKLEQKENQIDSQKIVLEQTQKLLDKQMQDWEKKLQQLSGLDANQAKELILQDIKSQYSNHFSDYIEKLKVEANENARFEASKIIATSLPRLVSEYTWEYTSSLIDLPSEDTKWRIIGREGRNIAIFERLTWVEIVIDDTPLVVKLSSYDWEKRFLASETLKRLVKDGRINPHYIEKTYNEVLQSKDELVLEKWKEALSILWIPKLPKEIVQMVWRFYFRYSYGQNLWSHSIEVGRLAWLIASELWLDVLMAKKAGLLHDIWKIAENSSEGHARIWADILRSFWMDEIIINTAEWHHYDVPMIHPIAWVATAADTVSASRPWARYDTRELYIERMQSLETLVNSVSGIQKSYIMQAWREIIAFVDPEKVDDLQMQQIVYEIWQKIEDQMDYPWMIRVVWIRESKSIALVK